MIMSDPEIFKSDTPHRVSMPEGSSNAVGKKAEVGEASIRKVLSEGSGESNELQREEEVTKGPAAKLSLDDEIAAANALLKKKKELRAEKDGVKTDDDLRAEKAGHHVSDDLRAKAGVGDDKELKAAKGLVSPEKDLRAEKDAVNASDDLRAGNVDATPSGDLRAGNVDTAPSGDLRAEKEGVNNHDLRAPKEAVSGGDLKAPKDILDSLDDLLAPKEAAKTGAELRGPKELVQTNTAAGLSSADSLVTLRTGVSDSKESSVATQTAPAAASEAPTDVAASGAKEPSVQFRPEPEMDFPARVVHLKIENDNLRSALDKLESEP
jgi:hypothetical protein